MISEKFEVRVKLSPKRGYQITHLAGIHPSTLSRIVCGIETLSLGDKRVKRIAKVLRLDERDCFI